MDNGDGEQGASAQEDEGGIDTEEIGIGELDDGAGCGCSDRDVGMSYTKLIKVVKVRQAEDKRRKEDGAPHAMARQQEERNSSGAEQTLLSYRTLYGNENDVSALGLSRCWEGCVRDYIPRLYSSMTANQTKWWPGAVVAAIETSFH